MPKQLIPLKDKKADGRMTPTKIDGASTSNAQVRARWRIDADVDESVPLAERIQAMATGSSKTKSYVFSSACGVKRQCTIRQTVNLERIGRCLISPMLNSLIPIRICFRPIL